MALINVKYSFDLNFNAVYSSVYLEMVTYLCTYQTNRKEKENVSVIEMAKWNSTWCLGTISED